MYINYHGCDVYTGGIYRPHPSNDDDAEILYTHLYDSDGEVCHSVLPKVSPAWNGRENYPFRMHIQVLAGSYREVPSYWYCKTPTASPMGSALYFILFTVVSALVMLR